MSLALRVLAIQTVCLSSRLIETCFTSKSLTGIRYPITSPVAGSRRNSRYAPLAPDTVQISGIRPTGDAQAVTPRCSSVTGGRSV